MRLDGKVAAVTGAGRGIGRNIARSLAQLGARVVVNDIGAAIDGTGTNGDIAASVVADIRKASGDAVAHVDSVATFAGAESLIDCALSHFGRIDIVVNCAGNAILGLPWELSESDWDSVVDTHLKGHFAVMRAASAPMCAQGSGTMIAVTSRAGLNGVANSVPYSSAKAGIIGLTKSFALAMAPCGATVNAITPSASTRLSEPPAELEALRARALGMGIVEAGERTAGELRRMMEDTATIESLVAFLVTPVASSITGRIFTVSNRHIGLLGPWNEIAALDADALPWSLDALVAALPRSELGRLAAGEAAT
jgi:NAD(P)-dependent dehydrogenase (short-subunit alcohol dehydrogenase family)